jgi:diguanylate cyclase (GGDEF)-like protein
MSVEDTHPDLLVELAATDPDPLVPAIPTAYLVHIHPSGPALGTRHPLTGASAVLGRDGGCDISVPDPSVSRQHARLQWECDGYMLIDLQSTNGTCVNKVPVSRCKLRDGDDLRFGNCVYRFLASDNVEAQYHAEIHRLTVCDPLTQVPNRRFLEQVLPRELQRAQRYRRPLALVLVDIDDFKAVNDKLGHVAGDFTLRELAARIHAAVRKEGLCARYGGEEFAVLLPEANLDVAVQVAERIRKQVEQGPLRYRDARYAVTISAGVTATRGEESLTCEQFVNRADVNLYRAKRQGKNRVCGDGPHGPDTATSGTEIDGLKSYRNSASFNSIPLIRS